MNSDDSISSQSAADDAAWARNGLGFELGVSTWRDRVAAIVHSSGSRVGAATLLGSSLHDIKNWLNKARNTPAPREPQRIADAAGLSLSYVVSGIPRVPRDFEVELDRLSKAKSEFVPTGTTASRRTALRQLVERLRNDIETARAAAMQPQPPFAAPVRVEARPPDGLADQPDGLALLPTMTTKLGQAALSDDTPSPVAFSHEWLVRQRLDPADLGVVEQRDGLYVVDTSARARALADQCLYAVVEAEGLSICQWQRRAEGGELVLLRPIGTDPRRNPADIVGRVVYELAPR